MALSSMLSLILVLFIIGFNITFTTEIDTFTTEDPMFAFEVIEVNKHKNETNSEPNKKAQLYFDNNLDVKSIIPKEFRDMNKFGDININVYEFPEDNSMKPCKYKYKCINCFKINYNVSIFKCKQLKLNKFADDAVSKISKILRESARREIAKAPPPYDLDDSDNLFKNYMKAYNKHIPKNKASYMRHYLRFVKTLWEINENNKNKKNPPMTLNDEADVLKEAHEYHFTF